MHNTLDHDTEELEQITPYVLSRAKILKMTGYWKQDDTDAYLLACYPALVIPSFLPNQVDFQLPKHFQSQMKHSQETLRYFRVLSLM